MIRKGLENGGSSPDLTSWRIGIPSVHELSGVEGETYDESMKTLRERSRVGRGTASEDTHWNQR